MSGMSVSYHPEHQVVIVRTAESPVICQDLSLARLEHLGGPIRLINCDIGEFISKSSAEIYESTIKTIKVAEDVLLQNSRITTVSCNKIMVDFGGNQIKQRKAPDMIYLKAPHSRKITPFCTEKGVNVYVARGPFSQPMILSAL
jgi:hypothetical protein